MTTESTSETFEVPRRRVSIGTGPAPEFADSDIAAQAQQDLLEAARNRKLIKPENLKKLQPWEMAVLQGMKCVEHPAGGLSIIGRDGQHADVEIHEGCVSLILHGDDASDENLETILRGAIVARAKFGTDPVPIRASSELVFMMMAKASELEGMTISNAPAAGQRLQDKHPEIAARMEAAWKKTGGRKSDLAASAFPAANAGARDGAAETFQPAAGDRPPAPVNG